MGYKTLDIECVNRVKIEDRNEFENSIFEGVYRTALKRLDDLVTLNESLKNGGAKEQYCYKNEMSNVISFIGERGMGKSSAMLSLAYVLKGVSADGLHKLGFQNTDTYFYVLPKVDAGLLTRESVFDDILAAMWSVFSEKYQNVGIDGPEINHTKDMFNKIKDAYTKYYEDEKSTRHLTSVRQLEELAGGLRLRKLFADLVQDFLKCMGEEERCRSKKIMIVPIDDLDLASNNIVGVLEQLLVFLSVPNVIILTTLNIEKLLLSCKKKFAEEHLYAHNTNDYELQSVRNYADQYVAKVLPRNNRIYMPRVEPARSAHLNNEKLDGILVGDIEARDFSNVMFAKYTNLLKPCSTNGGSAENLRNFVNKLNEIWIIASSEDGSIHDQLMEWLEKDVNVERTRLESEKDISFLTRLMNNPAAMANKIVIDYLESKEDVFSHFNTKENIEGYGYGKILMMLSYYRNYQYTHHELVNVVAELYCLNLAQCALESNEVANSYVRGDILTSVFRYTFNMDINKGRVDVAKLFLVNWKLAKDPFEAITENKKALEDIFRVMLFFDADRIIEDIRLSVSVGEMQGIAMTTDEPVMQRVFVEADSIRAKVSIDNFFRNILRYRELYQRFLEVFFEAFYESKIRGSKKKKELYACLLDMIDEDPGIMRYEEWIKQYDPQSIYDIIPIQNVNVMLDVMDAIEDLKMSRGVYPSNNIDLAMELFLDSFIDTFAKAELHIKDRKEGDKSYSEKRYSEKMRGLKEMLGDRYINRRLFARCILIEGARMETIDVPR